LKSKLEKAQKGYMEYKGYRKIWPQERMIAFMGQDSYSQIVLTDLHQ
jgi:hypothetical protein